MLDEKKLWINKNILNSIGIESEADTDEDSDHQIVMNPLIRDVSCQFECHNSKKIKRPSKKPKICLSKAVDRGSDHNELAVDSDPYDNGLDFNLDTSMKSDVSSYECSSDIEVKKQRINPEQELNEGVIRIQLITNPAPKSSLEWIEQFRKILHTQLPNIPSDHHKELVYDRKHRNYIIIKEGKAVGGITFHPITEVDFTEIVFFAVTEFEQKAGYGSLLMSTFKKHVQDLDYPLRVITFADKRAICFFKKKGFMMHNRRDMMFRDFLNTVPEYTNAILMLCELSPAVMYPKIQHVIDKVLAQLKTNKHAWPFEEPVDGKVVAWYYKFVKNPIDLQTISMRNNKAIYKHPRQFINDLKLMFENCYHVNDIDTQYYEAGYELNRTFNEMSKKYFPKADIIATLPPEKPEWQAMDIVKVPSLFEKVASCAITEAKKFVKRKNDQKRAMRYERRRYHNKTVWKKPGSVLVNSVSRKRGRPKKIVFQAIEDHVKVLPLASIEDKIIEESSTKVENVTNTTHENQALEDQKERVSEENAGHILRPRLKRPKNMD